MSGRRAEPSDTVGRWRRLVVVAVLTLLGACSRAAPEPGVIGGDVARGQAAFVGYGCVACHAVSGVPNADGRVGPALDGFADQHIIAGHLPNTTDNLIRWIRAPQSVDPGTVMPDVGVSEEDAVDLAAFLATLRDR